MQPPPRTNCGGGARPGAQSLHAPPPLGLAPSGSAAACVFPVVGGVSCLVLVSSFRFVPGGFRVVPSGVVGPLRVSSFPAVSRSGLSFARLGLVLAPGASCSPPAPSSASSVPRSRRRAVPVLAPSRRGGSSGRGSGVGWGCWLPGRGRVVIRVGCPFRRAVSPACPGGGVSCLVFAVSVVPSSASVALAVCPPLPLLAAWSPRSSLPSSRPAAASRSAAPRGLTRRFSLPGSRSASRPACRAPRWPSSPWAVRPVAASGAARRSPSSGRLRRWSVRAGTASRLPSPSPGGPVAGHPSLSVLVSAGGRLRSCRPWPLPAPGPRSSPSSPAASRPLVAPGARFGPRSPSACPSSSSPSVAALPASPAPSAPLVPSAGFRPRSRASGPVAFAFSRGRPVHRPSPQSPQEVSNDSLRP